MATKRPTTTTLKWCQQEIGPICEGMSMVVKSQIGYGGRAADRKIRRAVLKNIVMAGEEVDPLK
uniref:Uncharacterized protein n=1 Tax=Caenorhabditis japonica TaxID=281687 RepID=A0A8R1E207_CAEJA